MIWQMREVMSRLFCWCHRVWRGQRQWCKCTRAVLVKGDLLNTDDWIIEHSLAQIDFLIKKVILRRAWLAGRGFTFGHHAHELRERPYGVAVQALVLHQSCLTKPGGTGLHLP